MISRALVLSLSLSIFFSFQALEASAPESFRNLDQSFLSETPRKSWQQWPDHLLPGDIILVPLRCWSCYYIEDETGYPFSHSALVLDVYEVDGVKKALLAEALIGVRSIELSKWVSMLREDAPWVVVRPDFIPGYFSDHTQRGLYLRSKFDQHYRGLSFDSQFLWDTYDEKGETLYCSEFIYKILYDYLDNPLHTFNMDFSRNWEFWFDYYKGDVPQGAIGFSPGDFLRFDGMSVVFWYWPHSQK